MAKLGDGIEKFVDESAPFIIEKLGDFSALENSGHLTVAQCAFIAPSQMGAENQEAGEEMADHYIKLVLYDIAQGNLDPKNPITRLPYSEYLRMMSEGLFGEDGEEMPLPTFDWLVSLDDAERWLQSKGIPADFDGIRADLRGDVTSKGSLGGNKKKWDKAQLASLWEENLMPGKTHKALAEKHGVSRQRIGKLLDQAREHLTKKIKSSHQPAGGVTGMKDGKKF